MRQRASDQRSSRRNVILLMIAAILFLVAGPRIEPVANVLSPVYVPINALVSGVADDVNAFASSLINLPGLQRDNGVLRRQNAHLLRNLGMLPILRRENAALTQENHFADLNPRVVRVSSRVIGRSELGLGSAISIDSGSNEGVRLGNPVVDPNGLVLGKVVRVWRATAQVGLLTESDVNVPAMDARTGAMGIVETAPGQAPAIHDVPIGGKLKSGDLIVTSGLRNEFPIGSYIGQVTAVSSRADLAMQSASIRTAADLNNIDYVQVLTNFYPGAHLTYRPSVTSRLHSP